MKMRLTTLLLIGLLCFAAIAINNVSAQDGRFQQMNLFFEYLNPAWRLHRARLRPFVFSNPDPVWRSQG